MRLYLPENMMHGCISVCLIALSQQVKAASGQESDQQSILSLFFLFICELLDMHNSLLQKYSIKHCRDWSQVEIEGKSLEIFGSHKIPNNKVGHTITVCTRVPYWKLSTVSGNIQATSQNRFAGISVPFSNVFEHFLNLNEVHKTFDEKITWILSCAASKQSEIVFFVN